MLKRAERIALSEGDRLFERLAPIAMRDGKVEPVAPRIPEVSGSSAYADRIGEAQGSISRSYRDAALNAELRILMALEAEQDDEDAILLSL